MLTVLAAVEVTTSTICEDMQVLARLKEQGLSVPAVDCQNSWIIDVLPTARIKFVRENIDRYLAAIEAEGRNQFCLGEVSPSVSKILEDLQVAEGLTLKRPPPPRIWIGGPSGEGHIVKAAELQIVVEAEANKEDNRRKRSAGQVRERHLFVWIEPINTAAWSAIIMRCIPAEPPVLPAEITHVWAAAEAQGKIFVWLANPPRGWQDLGTIRSVE